MEASWINRVASFPALMSLSDGRVSPENLGPDLRHEDGGHTKDANVHNTPALQMFHDNTVAYFGVQHLHSSEIL